MDSYMGNSQDPISLHKYLYANANPLTYTDPTGHYSIAQLSNNIAVRGILAGVQYGGYLQSIRDIVNGNVQFSAVSIIQEIIFNQIRGSKALIRLAQSRLKWLKNLWKKRGKDKLPGNCNSFDGETLVATENGLVPIEDIEIGDKVWAYNETNHTKSLQKVTHLIRGEGDKTLTDITLNSGEIITATSNHPFWAVTEQNWTEAGELRLDTILWNINDKNSTISTLRSYTKKATVYNLTVDNDHTYFVGVGGVLGHNSGCGDKIFDEFKSKSELLNAGKQLDKGLLTKAGRGLQKHGSREGSVFPSAKGNEIAKNEQGQIILENILKSDIKSSTPNRFGGYDIFDKNTGRGVRYDENGMMKGFLEPNE